MDEKETEFENYNGNCRENSIPFSSAPSLTMAEHSYCISFANLSEDHEQEHFNDLFVVNSPESESSHIFHPVSDEVYSPVGFSIELGDEINFDGFNFSVPSTDERGSRGGGDDSKELENMWGGWSTADGILNTDINTVEVAASSDSDAVSLTEGKLEEIDKYSDLMILNEIGTEKDNVKSNKRKRSQGGVRRTKISKNEAFIQDPEQRKNYFELNFKHISLQLHRARNQTKCKGELSAFFQGKVINAASNHTKSGEKLLEPNNTQLNPEEHTEMDDHRYAATMITQSISSSAVRDHQYNEKFVDLGQESFQFDFIRGQAARDQAFCKYALSLFTEKSNLQIRTGAQVKLFLEYENITITDKNFIYAPNLIKNKRGTTLDKVFRRIAPAPPATTLTQANEQCVLSPAAPLTLIIPNLNDNAKSPLMIPFSYSTANSTSLNSPSSTTASKTKTGHEEFKKMQQQPSGNILLNEINDASNDSLNDKVNDNHSLPFFDELSAAFPHFSEVPCLQNPSPSSQSSPSLLEAISTGRMKDSVTNTEPICSICQNDCDKVSASGRDKVAPYWIRCNDPFCYDMVHASCVGFAVTHSSHLKQLPAFYCKSHR